MVVHLLHTEQGIGSNPIVTTIIYVVILNPLKGVERFERCGNGCYGYYCVERL
jgi:hypothetical protein